MSDQTDQKTAPCAGCGKDIPLDSSGGVVTREGPMPVCSGSVACFSAALKRRDLCTFGQLIDVRHAGVN